MLKNKSFIFVTGHPRSGTTFAGKVIASPKDVQYLSEPFNPTFGHKSFHRYFIYINEEKSDIITQEASEIINDFLNGKAKFRKLNIQQSRTLKQKIGRIFFGNKNTVEFLNFKYNPYVKTALIKDPTIVLATSYFLTLGVPTLFLIRHPAATVASCKRLNMKHDISILKDQPALKPLVEKYAKEYNLDKMNDVQRNALHWLFINRLVLKDSNINNKKLLVKTHEDLSSNPIDNFKEIFKHFGVEYTQSTESKIVDLTSRRNPAAAPGNAMHHLKRNSKDNIILYKNILTKKEISQIKEIAGDFASTFYDDGSWL